MQFVISLCVMMSMMSSLLLRVEWERLVNYENIRNATKLAQTVLQLRMQHNVPRERQDNAPGTLYGKSGDYMRMRKRAPRGGDVEDAAPADISTVNLTTLHRRVSPQNDVLGDEEARYLKSGGDDALYEDDDDYHAHQDDDGRVRSSSHHHRPQESVSANDDNNKLELAVLLAKVCNVTSTS